MHSCLIKRAFVSAVHWSSALRLYAAASFAALIIVFAVPGARAAGISIPPQAHQALDAIYSGDSATALALAHALQAAQPQHPLGYLIEDEALWWQRYCAACEIKYGMVEASKRGKAPGDEQYLALASRVTQLAQAQLAKSDTAEMRVYAGMGWVLKVRVYAMRGENRNAARAAVNGRAEMLRAVALDSDMADATAALGMYNYYVDALSPVVRLLRFFLGIPGGDKSLGVKQMETGMTRGVLLATDVRFVLARALRQYDRQYQQALDIASPLVGQFPRNPLFELLVGNLNAELGRTADADKAFRAALTLSASVTDPICAARAQDIASKFLQNTP